MTSPQMLLGPVFEEAMSLFTDEPPATKPYQMYVTGEGATFGNGEPITRTIETFLQDIAVILIDGYTTRDVTIVVWVEAGTARDLQQAEADLMAQLYRPNLLWWQPPHTAAPWAVFEVATSKLVVPNLGDTDFDESELRRSYTISLTCGAWVRSKDEEIAGFVDADTPAVDVVFSTGATLTDVSAVRHSGTGGPPVLSLVSGTVRATIPNGGNTHSEYIKFGGHTFDPDTPYVVVDVVSYTSNFEPDTFRMLARRPAGAGYDTFDLVVRTLLSTGGFRYYFARPSTATTVSYDEIMLWATFIKSGPSNSYVSVDNIKATSAPPTAGGPRQKMFNLEIGGAVDANGTIVIHDETDALGWTLAYTFVDPTGLHAPALRPWRTDGETITDDALTPSGHKEALGDAADNATTFLVPVNALPDGTYDLCINSWNEDPDGVVVSWAARLLINGHAVADVGEGSALTVTPSLDANDFTYSTIGQFTLPAARLPASSVAYVEITIWAAPGVHEVTFDDGYLLNIDIGAYTIVNCGLGTVDVGDVNSEIQLLSPTLDWPAPSIMVGVHDDPTSFYSPDGVGYVAAWGRHELPPGKMGCMVVTGYNAADDALGEVRYHRRSHTNTDR